MTSNWGSEIKLFNLRNPWKHKGKKSFHAFTGTYTCSKSTIKTQEKGVK